MLIHVHSCPFLFIYDLLLCLILSRLSCWLFRCWGLVWLASTVRISAFGKTSWHRRWLRMPKNLKVKLPTIFWFHNFLQNLPFWNLCTSAEVQQFGTSIDLNGSVENCLILLMFVVCLYLSLEVLAEILLPLHCLHELEILNVRYLKRTRSHETCLFLLLRVSIFQKKHIAQVAPLGGDFPHFLWRYDASAPWIALSLNSWNCLSLNSASWSLLFDCRWMVV